MRYIYIYDRYWNHTNILQLCRFILISWESFANELCLLFLFFTNPPFFLFPESRETAYIYSISSAGVMYSVTRACAQGTLIGCGCDDTVRKQDTEGQFEWGGCSENLQFGAKFSEEFVDTREHIQDRNEFGLMNLWNNKAGRLVRVQCFWLDVQYCMSDLFRAFRSL